MSFRLHLRLIRLFGVLICALAVAPACDSNREEAQREAERLMREAAREEAHRLAEETKEAADRLAEEAKETAGRAVEDIKRKVRERWLKRRREKCPKCGARAELESRSERHVWWKCQDCGLAFATYSGGHSENRNKYKGYCTWYVRDRWLWDGNPFVLRGHAKDWYDNAPAEMRSRNPVEGAVAVFGASARNPYGHVAYVEEVTASSFTVWHMNAGPGYDPKTAKTSYFDRVTRITFPMSATSYAGMPLLGFIKPTVSAAAPKVP